MDMAALGVLRPFSHVYKRQNEDGVKSNQVPLLLPGGVQESSPLTDSVDALWNPLVSYIYVEVYILAMTKSDARAFLPLKTQWFHIMLSLAGGEQHGYGIMQEVLERTTGKVRLWPATLYGSIKRLIEAELIEESDKRPAPEEDDARRRYYRLTAHGKRVLDAECDRLQDLVRTIRVKRRMVTE